MRESDVVSALASLGGQATGLQIYRYVLENSRWCNRPVLAEINGITVGGMYAHLRRLEREGRVATRLETVKVRRGFNQQCIYTMKET